MGGGQFHDSFYGAVGKQQMQCDGVFCTDGLDAGDLRRTKEKACRVNGVYEQVGDGVAFGICSCAIGDGVACVVYFYQTFFQFQNQW